MTEVNLSQRHWDELEKGSAISRARIAARGYRSIEDVGELPAAFADYQRRPGLLIPIRSVNNKIESWQLKPDIPRLNSQGKPLKYETASGARQMLDVPQSVVPLLGNPLLPLWITEGPKKVDAGLCHGVGCIVGLQGVFGWRGTNEHGGKVALSDWEQVALNRREVVLAFDSDVMRKPEVRAALDRLSNFLGSKGAEVRYLLLPDLADGGKCGLDDWFVHGGTLNDLMQHVHKDLEGTTLAMRPDIVPTANVVRMQDVEAKPIDWLWPGWLPKGMLTLLGGYAGDGKSTLTMSLAAAFSTGGALPDGATAPVTNTLLLAAEDDLAHVVKPRLQVHGANMSRIVSLQGIQQGEISRQFTLRGDLSLLKQLVIENEIGLVVIDPLSSYLANGDRNSEGDVRDTLQPLVQLMEQTGVAVLGIMHVGKTDGQSRAFQKLMGSTAFTALARSVWMVCDLPVDFQVDGEPTRKMLGVSKSNYAVPPRPIQYCRPQDGANQFLGDSPVSIEAVFTWKPKPEKVETERDMAEEWLLEFMNGQRVLASEVEAAVTGKEFSFATVKKAKLRLGLKSQREGKEWYWLPQHSSMVA